MSRFSLHSRAVRLIGAARMTLAAFTLLAARLNPAEPGYSPEVFRLLNLYLLFSVVLFSLFGVFRRLPSWWQAATHVVELLIFVGLMQLTGGEDSPFFVYFTFSLVCATVRWQWRGTLWTAVATLLAFVLMAARDFWLLDDPSFNVNLLILRSVSLAVLSLLLGYLGARQTKLDHTALRERREAAALEERTRLSRDLHDGLLQSLTGIALQLEALHPLIQSDPKATEERLREIQSSIAGEQRDLRALVERLRPIPPGQSLALRLEEMSYLVQRQWGIAVKLTTDGLGDRMPDALAEEVGKIVKEALVNAARHADASRVEVQVVRGPRRVRVRVADDGHGFSFRGRYGLEALEQMNAGPLSLRERIASLGGELVISSADTGSSLDIELPLPRARV